MSINNQEYLLTKALNCQSTPRVPVWFMRQAGRYLPEYREVRKQAGSFTTLCKTPELAAKVTMQPWQRYAVDAMVIFSDILVVPDAMGLGLQMQENIGPVFERPVNNLKDIENLPTDGLDEKLAYTPEAIKLVIQESDAKVPVVGFCGSPWTVATYMVEGRSSKNFSKIKQMLYDAPDSLHQLLLKVSKVSVEYLINQVKAGASALMIFDTWGGILTPSAYQEFSYRYLDFIAQQMQEHPITKDIPIIFYAKNLAQHLPLLASSRANCLGVDWTINIKDVKNIIAQHSAQPKAVQGNLDPAVLYAKPEIIQQHVTNILTEYGKDPGHIFNLGHGIYPDINPEHVQVMIDTVKNFKFST